MHSEVRDCLRTALRQALWHAHQGPQQYAQFMVFSWTRGGWQGRSELRPVLPTSVRYPHELAEPLQRALVAYYPEHVAGVGTAYIGVGKLDAGQLLYRMIQLVWSRHSAFDVGENAIDGLVAEFAEFIDATEIRISYLAPILNLELDASITEIELSSGVKVRRISDAEATELYGGRMDRPWYRDPHRMPTCAFAGQFAEPKWFGTSEVFLAQALQEFQRVHDPLRRAVRVLRSFKSGPVGYREFHMKPLGFCPWDPGTRTDEAEHILLGSYALRADELDSFQVHAQQMAACLHTALDLAISRLSDAEVRVSPRDKLIDAVIGLEALLLPKDTQQELGHRFALDYACLGHTPDGKASRFRTAKDLYACRSMLVHGGRPVGDDDLVRVGGKKVPLKQAAGTACEMLREVVKVFLPHGAEPAFREEGYWERRWFGLEHPEQ